MKLVYEEFKQHKLNIELEIKLLLKKCEKDSLIYKKKKLFQTVNSTKKKLIQQFDIQRKS